MKRHEQCEGTYGRLSIHDATRDITHWSVIWKPSKDTEKLKSNMIYRILFCMEYAILPPLYTLKKVSKKTYKKGITRPYKRPTIIVSV